MIGAVFDFIGARFFVFFDDSTLVFVQRTAGDDAGLTVRFGRETINVNARLGFASEDFLVDKLLQILLRAFCALKATI